jgi:hypothetical protein
MPPMPILSDSELDKNFRRKGDIEVKVYEAEHFSE